MIKKRIGTDLFLSLTVLTEDGNPVDFTNAKGMKVCIYNAIQKQYYFDVEFTVKDNVISTQFTACNNKRLGVFNIIVKWKVPFAESETSTVTYAVDFTNAFAVVATSEEELLPSTSTFIGYVKESYVQPTIEYLTISDLIPVIIAVNYSTVVTDPNLPIGVCVEGYVTHYRYSESEDLLNVEWIPFYGNWGDLALSQEFGNKNIFFQVKNKFGESAVFSFSVEYKSE